jgi:hypothetical protein
MYTYLQNIDKLFESLISGLQISGHEAERLLQFLGGFALGSSVEHGQRQLHAQGRAHYIALNLFRQCLRWTKIE